MITQPLHPAYAAGILDGEGTLFIANSSGKCFYPCIAVGMTDITIPRMLYERYGGYLDERKWRDKAKWATPYYWKVQKADLAMNVIKDVWPYLTLKKPQAAVIANMLRYAPNRRAGRRPVTGEELALRYQMRDLIRTLNKRGPCDPLSEEDSAEVERLIRVADLFMEGPSSDGPSAFGDQWQS